MGVVHRLARRFWLRNGRAHVEGRRAVIVLSARGARFRHMDFFLELLCLHKHLFRLSLSTPALGLFTPRSSTES